MRLIPYLLTIGFYCVRNDVIASDDFPAGALIIAAAMTAVLLQLLRSYYTVHASFNTQQLDNQHSIPVRRLTLVDRRQLTELAIRSASSPKLIVRRSRRTIGDRSFSIAQ